MRAKRGVFSLVLCLVLACSSTVSSASSYIRGIFVGHSPSPVPMDWIAAWKVAEKEASAKTGAFVVCGSGSSMEPLYNAGTILVVAPVAYENLVAGTTVLYYNEEGTPVMHVLVARARNGWRVAGLNNPVHDATPVTSKNLAGIVTHAFLPEGKPSLGHVLRIASR